MTGKEDIYFSRIMVAVDDSETSLKALKYAIHRAKKDDLPLIIASVLESPQMSIYEAMSKDFVHGKREDLETHLEEFKKQAESQGVKKVVTVVAEGKPGETIVKEVIPQMKPDLLVIGSDAKTGLARNFGSQAAYMAKNSPTSVMVIR